MQIPNNLLRIIFMLSTIVAVTDCCSSRILFLREQTFNIIQQHKMQQYQQQQQQGNDHHQQVNEKYEQHVHSGTALSSENIFNKNHTNVNSDDDESPSGDEQSANDGLGKETSAHLDRPPPISKDDAVQPTKGSSDTSVLPTTKENIREKPAYGIFDLYYNIMRDVLSIPCTGQILTEFCLNGGRCFSYPIGNHTFPSCECADGYEGERCEWKTVNGVVVATSTLDSDQPKIRTARVIFSFPMLIFLTITYLFFGMAIVFKCQSPLRYKTAPHSSRAAGLLCT
ncbi:gurken [Musca autumnalis]|uniref:gurken n=1 Tax=Musca autumnalis TaxID=221902 RepID=UPI003CF3399D